MFLFILNYILLIFVIKKHRIHKYDSYLLAKKYFMFLPASIMLYSTNYSTYLDDAVNVKIISRHFTTYPLDMSEREIFKVKPNSHLDFFS